MEPLTHEQLLTLARKVQAAAHDGDVERFERERRHLYEALRAHLDAERETLSRLPESRRQELDTGQQHLLDLLGRLRPAGSPLGVWSNVADELLAYLDLQAHEERGTLDGA